MKLNAAQIDYITTEERNRTAIIHLKDGRVIVINDEGLCVYADGDAFWFGEVSQKTICFEDLIGGAK